MPGFSKSSPQPVTADDKGLRSKAPAGTRRAAERATGGRIWRWFLNGAHPAPATTFVGTVEDPEEDKVGICCSGGGIRSAAFSLGALQALQEKGELERASYLAAVSGGAYIAAAFSTVAKTGPEDSDGALFGGLNGEPPFAAGSPEEQYLRNRSAYLAPT